MKLQRADVSLERRETAQNAINGSLNAFNGQRVERDAAEFWVTVFGFSSEDRAGILNKFNRFGNIVNHKVPPTGNWVHLRYSAVEHVNQALQRNGFVLDNRLMIGVKRCTDKVSSQLFAYRKFYSCIF